MGVGAARRGLAYVVKSKDIAGSFRPFATAHCHRCEQAKELRVPGNSNNPEQVQKAFRADGWEFDSWNARRCICPTCIKARNDERHGDSGRREGENIVTLHKAPGGASSPAPAAPAPAVVPARPVLALPPNKSELSVDERSRVRTLLGGTFDEAAGQYSEGWSDQRVAKEAGGLPPKLIADLREAAFGPILEVAELEPIKAEFAKLEQRFDQHLKASDVLKAELATLRDRLAETSKRLGVRQ